MTDAIWLLWNRAPIDYAIAATMWLLIRMRRDETKARQPGPADCELSMSD